MSTVDRLIERYRGLGPALYWVLTAIGACYVALSIAGLSDIGGCDGPIVACDAAAYYFTDHGPYAWSDAPPGVPPYRYAPAFLWAFAPFRLLSFDVFVWAWAGLHLAGLLWLRAGWLLAMPGVNEDVIRGNINVFVAMLIVIAIRYPIAWAPVILTKVTPGIGLVWHAVRGEWKSVGIALATVAAVTAIGMAIDRDLWITWLQTLGGGPDDYAGVDNLLPLPVRLVMGIGVVAVAAATTRAWLLPIGILIGWPGLLPPALMILAAIPRLRAVRLTARAPVSAST